MLYTVNLRTLALIEHMYNRKLVNITALKQSTCTENEGANLECKIIPWD